MRSRYVWIGLAVVLVAVAVVAVWWVARPSADGPYALAEWEYGAIAWVEPTREDSLDVAARAAELFQKAFALWGFATPRAVAGGRVARRADPAGGPTVDLRALEWKGALLPPVVLVIFPDAETLEQATGLETCPITLAYGNPPPAWWDEDPISIDLADWMRELTGASVAFVCTADRWEEHLAGETAKWMLNKGTEIPELCECAPHGLPSLVLAGMAGYTARQILGDDDWFARSQEWASTNEITTNLEGLMQFDVDGETLSFLGTSFIAYLVFEEADPNEMVSTICDWRGTGRYCGEETSRTIRYIRGWRAFLGVEPEG